jgi:hypothetical protein
VEVVDVDDIKVEVVVVVVEGDAVVKPKVTASPLSRSYGEDEAGGEVEGPGEPLEPS